MTNTPTPSPEPLHHDTAHVTHHDNHIWLQAGFSEIPLPTADALVLAGELLAACGYTYTIHRIQDGAA